MNIPDYTQRVASIKKLMVVPMADDTLALIGNFGAIFYPGETIEAECCVTDRKGSYEGKGVTFMRFNHVKDAPRLCKKLGIEYVDQPHSSPSDNCCCGLYSYDITSYDLEDIFLHPIYDEYGIGSNMMYDLEGDIKWGNFVCIMSNWGKIIQHDRGFRAQYQRLEAILDEPRMSGNAKVGYQELLGKFRLKGHRVISEAAEAKDFIQNNLIVI